jgi:ribosomal protein S18 acetylase RimI-like enzyme
MIIIENIQFIDIIEAANMVSKVFAESADSEYSSAGICSFYEKVTEHAIRERFFKGCIVNAAKVGGGIIGYIEIINSSHIYLLFVKKEFQNRGVGCRLVDFSLKQLKQSNPDLHTVTVNSTESAVKLYLKLGFTKMADFQFKNDMITVPMSKQLKD